jgi:hypothetical protein
MPKEAISNPHKGGLVRLKYTFRFGDQFIELDDDWLKCVEATSDELLGSYSKAEDNALSATFGSRKKKRLNRVFDAIGFMYPHYRYPARGQKRKSATSRKDDASAAPSEPAPKRKKVKVLTHRPRFIEPAIVPEFDDETSSVTEAKEPTLTQKNEEPAMMPKADNIEEIEAERTKTLEVISPSAGMTVPKAQKDLTVTPKRKRMVNVLDVLETIRSSSKTSRKTAERQKRKLRQNYPKPKLQRARPRPKLGLQSLSRRKSLETRKEEIEKETAEQNQSEKTTIPTPEALCQVLDYIVRHASGKRLSEEEKREAQYYAQKLKYPKGALIFNDSGEEDFLYCLPNNKEICVCREMGKSFGFPTLEDELSVLSKDELVDSLAYNSLKVRE